MTFGAFDPAVAGGEDDPSLTARSRTLLRRLWRHHGPTATHSLRVARATLAMWRVAPEVLGPAGTALLGSLLHDVGKLHVPRAILASSRLLTPEERAVMSGHPELGAELLRAEGFPEPVVAIARGHHERWAGGGYPGGGPAWAQPPILRAVAVADAFVAMTEPGRRYRAPRTVREALREVEACSGTHFDPMAAAILAESLSLPPEPLPFRFERRSRRPGVVEATL